MYSWKVGTQEVAGATTDVMTNQFADAQAYTVYVNVEQTTSGCKAVDSIRFEVKKQPVVSVKTNHDTVCSGYQVRLAATVDTVGAPNEPYTYTWYINGEEVAVTPDSVLYDTPTYVGESTDSMMFIYGVKVSQPSSYCYSAVSTDTVWVIPQPTVMISGISSAQKHSYSALRTFLISNFPP